MDLVCYSHLRWNFVYQRPQHLLSRFAKRFRVFYIEEPIYNNQNTNSYQVTEIEENLWIIAPHLESELSESEHLSKQQNLLSDFFKDYNIQKPIFWYYTPMALPLSSHLTPELTVYDCMDELSAFKFAPPSLKILENELLKKADIVFTGGYSLYNAKKNAHHNIHPFPSSIDKEHFAKARFTKDDPPDQSSIPHPRFGFCGVIDERFHLELLSEVARRKPEWHFIIIGPVVKIDENSLPRYANIHYLGGKTYNELPAYLSGWDIAVIPFVLNDSTKYISPTKTPEYLAAGKPVISTSITDVVNPYANKQVVHIADNADQFIQAAEEELNSPDKQKWLADVDNILADVSWDRTWQDMLELIENALKEKKLFTNLNQEVHV